LNEGTTTEIPGIAPVVITEEPPASRIALMFPSFKL
jgi:hypothetical protein